MDNNSLDMGEILRNFGGTDINSLREALQLNENDGNYDLDKLYHSHYLMVDALPMKLVRNNTNFLTRQNCVE